MNILELATEALALIQSGQQTLHEIADAVGDGTVAVTSHDLATLKTMLAEEPNETQAAYDKLEDAIRTHESDEL